MGLGTERAAPMCTSCTPGTSSTAATLFGRMPPAGRTPTRPAAAALNRSKRMFSESLEQLMVAFGNAGENDKATDVFHLLQAHCQDYENFDRVLEYAEQNLGESGVVN